MVKKEYFYIRFYVLSFGGSTSEEIVQTNTDSC